MSDCQFEGKKKVIKLCIRRSKTQQAPTYLRIPCETESELCCVTSLQSYLELRPKTAEYLFCHANGLPLTRGQFTSVLARVLRSVGLGGFCYKSHSFRIGRATDLAAKGVPEESIQKMGRWSSKAYKNYIRM